MGKQTKPRAEGLKIDTPPTHECEKHGAIAEVVNFHYDSNEESFCIRCCHELLAAQLIPVTPIKETT